jgi:hypothetical protein
MAEISVSENQLDLVFAALDDKPEAIVEAKEQCRDGDVEAAKKTLLAYYRGRQGVRWFFRHEDRERLTRQFEQRFPSQALQAIERSDSILEGKWYWSGKYWECGFPPRWDEDRGDYEYTWGLNRHAFFRDLGLAYWLTGNEKYARGFAAIIADWISETKAPTQAYSETNRPWRVLEVGIRTKYWFPAWEFFIRSPEFSADLLVQILYSLIQHKDYLRLSSKLTMGGEDAVEEHYMANAAHNHYIMEMEGLLNIATMLPELKSSADDRDFAVAQLDRCQEAQILADGVHIEETPGYHSGCIHWFACPMLLGDLNNRPFKPEYKQNLKKMFNFLSHITRPDLTIAPFGDSAAAAQYNTISLGRIIFERPVTAQEAIVANQHPEKLLTPGTFWLSNGHEPDFRVMKRDFPLYEEFEKGGYFCMRSSWSDTGLYLAFRNGRGWHDKSGHQHADHLAIDVTAYGNPLIVDPGIHSYTDDEWREYFKATRNHNTISIDDRSSIEYRGNWRWGPYPDMGESDFSREQNRITISAWHDGFKPARCSRKITFVADRFWIVDDQVTGLTGNKVSIAYTFPTTAAELLNGNFAGARTLESEEKASVAVVQVVGDFGSSLENGWYSIRYLHKESCKVLRLIKENATGRCRTVCLIIPFPPGEMQDYSARSEGSVLEVEVGGDSPFFGRFSMN